MTRPSEAALRGARAASNRMADRNTPFVMNEWYVAAFAEELGRDLLKRTLLGKRVVMYRLEDGTPVAFADRCAHRSYPLSSGHLDGDVLVCGYHGFRYDSNGDVVEVPSASKCPKNIGVKRYALEQRGDLVWIWMGEAADADPATLRDHAWVSDTQWERSKGYYHLLGNYVSMHENLLDLTHLSFLHADTIGTPDYAKAAFDVKLEDGYYALLRKVVPTSLPPVWGKTTGLDGVDTAARIVTSEFKSPAFHQVNVTFYNNALPEGRPEFRIKTAHLPTPETHSSTHYFIVHGRDFAQDDEGVTHFMHENLFAAFNEDVVGMQLLEEVLDTTDPEDAYEFSVASDAPAVAMRRYLKDASARERTLPDHQSAAPAAQIVLAQ